MRYLISASQLKTAGGKVRCGECLTLFDARAQQLPRAKPKAKKAAPSSPSRTAARKPKAAAKTAAPKKTRTRASNTQQANRPETKVVKPTQKVPARQPKPVAKKTKLKPTTGKPNLPIERLPLELAYRNSNSTPWLSIISCLFLSLMLLLQAGYIYRDSAVQHSLTRPLYTAVYQWLDLPISERFNLAKLQLLELEFLDDPENPQLLHIRFTVQNSAAFAQPLPVIGLTFSDTLGNTVAKRDFSAADYLTEQPVQKIASASQHLGQLSVILPSPGLSYQLELISPQTSR